ncbi:hypothetical protein SUBVAR_05758 [Subdoligranulum variabile DSM 15176]|uniref:Uncharacterized protein n=1 Tax=Subdoligranulum variabile DSM 15176 TaxID=411471 RepID=D1PN43_9FIRM|nr:hypothetical protein SUBVAR_05758 [Subdoligranulum variabile DSM 15176]
MNFIVLSVKRVIQVSWFLKKSKKSAKFPERANLALFERPLFCTLAGGRC